MQLNTSITDIGWFQQNRRTLTLLFSAAMLACAAAPARSQEAPAPQAPTQAPAEQAAPWSARTDTAQPNTAEPSPTPEAGQTEAAPTLSNGSAEVAPAELAQQPAASATQPSGQPPADAGATAQAPAVGAPSAQAPSTLAPSAGTPSAQTPAGAAAPADATLPADVPANAASPAPTSNPTAAPNNGAQGPSSKEHLPHDLSPWGMFLAADIIVKGVMILLAVASVLAWSIWFGKSIQVSFSTRRLRRGMEELENDVSLAVAAERRRSRSSPLAVMIAAANDEVIRSQGGQMPAAGIKERVSSHLVRIEASAARSMSSGTGLLATIGSTAPFVGLFGTVWGIMNSFIGISQAQTTNLAVVAPGIAEALLATGIGLVAAIPAVIFYNQLARSISGYKGRLADCGAMVERLVSRDLDRQSVRTPYLKAGE